MKKSDLEKLQQQSGYPAVSILVPTHRNIPDKLQDRIRVKNLITQARNRLLDEFPERDVSNLLKNLEKLNNLIDYTDTLDGLALFVKDDFAELYRLPFSVEEQVTIDDNFETRNITFNLNRTPQYWLLTLSEKSTRLFNGIGDNLIEMIGPTTDQYGESTSGFPLNYLGPEESVLNAVGSGDRDALYRDDHIKQYFRFVDDFFYEHYLKEDQLPVFLGGTERNLTFYSNVSKHSDALAGAIFGSFEIDEYSAGEIAKKIWPVVQEYLAKERHNILKKLETAIGASLYAFSFEPVWRMAVEGRINTLLVEKNFRKSGMINPKNPTDIIKYDDPESPGISDDLVDNLIEMVQQKGNGKIVFYPPESLAEHDHIAAILRY